MVRNRAAIERDERRLAARRKARQIDDARASRIGTHQTAQLMRRARRHDVPAAAFQMGDQRAVRCTRAANALPDAATRTAAAIRVRFMIRSDTLNVIS